MSQTAKSRIDALRRRHEELKEKIANARKRPSVDDLLIAQLKKEKLVVKEQLHAATQVLEIKSLHLKNAVHMSRVFLLIINCFALYFKACAVNYSAESVPVLMKLEKSNPPELSSLPSVVEVESTGIPAIS